MNRNNEGTTNIADVLWFILLFGGLSITVIPNLFLPDSVVLPLAVRVASLYCSFAISATSNRVVTSTTLRT
jgi:hypothetical protein